MSVHCGQGDILLVAVAAIPDREVPLPLDDGQVVLAYGEATRYRHAIAGRDAGLPAIPGEEVERRFLGIMEAGALPVHDGHDPIPLPPGRYQVSRQREFVPEVRPCFVVD